MKKTVRVTIEKEYDIDIPEHLLTDEHIAAFESGMFELEGDNKVDELFKHVARCAAYDYWHAEGMGYFGSAYRKQYEKNPDDFIVVEEQCDDSEMEIL